MWERNYLVFAYTGLVVKYFSGMLFLDSIFFILMLRLSNLSTMGKSILNISLPCQFLILKLQSNSVGDNKQLGAGQI